MFASRSSWPCCGHELELESCWKQEAIEEAAEVSSWEGRQTKYQLLIGSKQIKVQRFEK